MRNRKKTNHPFRIMGFFAIFLLFLNVAYSQLSETLTITASAQLAAYEAPDYELSYEKITWFSEGRHYYNFNFVLKNNTNSNVANWKVILDNVNDKEEFSCTNADCDLSTGKIELLFVENNKLLNAKSEVTFEMSFSTTVADLEFDDYEVLLNQSSDDGETLPEPRTSLEGMDVTISEASSWTSGDSKIISLNVEIQNNTGYQMSSWEIGILANSKLEVDGAWSSTSEILDNNLLLIGNMNYNGTINDGASLSFGMHLKTSDLNYVPSVWYHTGTLEGLPEEPEKPVNPEDPDPEDPEEPEKPEVSDSLEGMTTVVSEGTKWQSGGKYVKEIKLNITNASSKNLSSWEIAFEVPEGTTVVGAWNMASSIQDNILTIKNLSYNGTININSSLNISMQLGFANENGTITVLYNIGK